MSMEGIQAKINNWIRIATRVLSRTGNDTSPSVAQHGLSKHGVGPHALKRSFLRGCTAVIRLKGFDLVVYADDLNMLKPYPRSSFNYAIQDDTPD